MMNKRILILIAACICIGSTQAQLKWPVVTQTMKPWTRWWWQGSAVDKAGLTTAMQQYQLAGLGGMEITPIYGVKGAESRFINFLSPQWVSMLEYTLKEGKRLGLGIDMATGTGWPFGGPWVTRTDACKYITYSTWDLQGGERLKDSVTFMQEGLVRTSNGVPLRLDQVAFPVTANKDLQAMSLDQVRYREPLPLVLLMAYDEKDNALDLTSRVHSGILDWVAPEGTWKLYGLFQGWHGKQVERAAPGGEGDVIDHFNDTALHHYLSHFDQAFAGRDISGLRSFFNDSYEVDDARGQSNWTPDFFDQFKQRRGYDLRTELPSLYQKENSDKHARILYDYRVTISELLLEKFTRPWDKWARSKGKMIRNQSHGSPANILDLYDAIDIPETEGEDILRFKFATSAAHVAGKPLASSESATWLNEHFISTLGDVKLAIDKYFAGGVNHVFYHGTNYSAPGETWPGWLFYAAVHFHPNNPFWKDFSTLNHYIARCQSFLQAGKPDNDILLYFPFNDRISEPGTQMLYHFDGMEGFNKTTFKSSAKYLLKKGYEFDLISDMQLQRVKAVNGALLTGGIAYKTILLPDVKLLTPETMQQLLELAANGATIIIYKNLPGDVPGFGNLAQRRSGYEELVKKLSFVKDGDQVKKASIGKGAFLMGDDLDALLNYAKVYRETMTDMGLQTVRRALGKGHYYFISNTSGQRIESWVPLQMAAQGSVLLFDPMFEKSGVAATKKAADGTWLVYLQLNSGESCVLQTIAAATTLKTFNYTYKTGKPQTIEGVWDLKFISGGPVLPPPVKLLSLESWTTLSNEDTKCFSGTAQYSIHVPAPRGGQAFLLDLGSVGESAEVRLNGKKIATLIGPVYQVIIPAASWKADNELQILVTNGMANRIADLDKRGIVWKKFYNINFPSRLAENRGADGLFTAAKWKPRASGLLSAVTITPVSFGVK